MFDLKFNKFVSATLIKFIYSFFLVVLSLAWIVYIIQTIRFKTDILQILIMFVGFPIAALLVLLIIRVICEKAIVTFKIYEKLSIISDSKTKIFDNFQTDMLKNTTQLKQSVCTKS